MFGDAPNVAARVQGLAEPGSVLVTMNVQRQVAGLFVVEDAGRARTQRRVCAGPALPHRARERRRAQGRRAGARPRSSAARRSWAMLARRWERALAGEGQLVLIVGEPGLGKSRLIEEFHARLGETPHTWSEWGASQLLQNTPLHPIAEWGRQRFGADAPADAAPRRSRGHVAPHRARPGRTRAPARAARGHSAPARPGRESLA